MWIRKCTFILAAILLPLCVSAQAPETNARFSVGTDIVTWANLGTANMNCSVAAGKNFSVHAEAQYNPWVYKTKVSQMQNKRQQYSLSARWWPWHVYSGWWLGGGAQYQEYNRGGMISQTTEEGDAVGLALSGGYTLMLNYFLNIDFSLGFWGGYKWYTQYSCPKCGRIIDDGRKFFLDANDISIALIFIF